MSPLNPLPTSAARRLGLLALGLATLLPMLGGSLANMVLPALGQAFAVPLPVCSGCWWPICWGSPA